MTPTEYWGSRRSIDTQPANLSTLSYQLSTLFLGTCLADGLGTMRPQQPRTPNREEIKTIHIPVEEVASEGPAMKVLLLEDRDDFREVLHDYLVSRSYQVTSVQSGIEGLREIMKARFDIVICDMMMPKMGGEMFYWAVTRVRPGTANHFIFFSGHKNNPRIEFFFQRVNATVVYKPFKLSVLDSVISDVLGKAGYATTQRQREVAG
jgi:CheY-like chemotaxis protein